MWPKCIEALKQFPHKLKAKPPADLAAAFTKAGWTGEHAALPLRMVALLGTCTTDKYKDCPTMPDWHIENAADEDDDYYLKNTGMYLWCDFDLLDKAGTETRLRMAFNEGDADCNDGTWGLVWDRDTAKVVAELSSVGDCEGRVMATSKKHVKAYKPHGLPIPTPDESLEASRVPFTLMFANDEEFEKLLGVAMCWCFSHRSGS